MSSLVDRAIVATLPRMPRTVVGRVASRYLAGERIEQAVAVIREINGRDLPASVAILGESVRSEPDARAMAAEYAELLAVLREQQLRCNVSLKPTAFGLELSAELAHELIDAFCRDAARDGTFVRVEMEHPESITAILDLYSRLRYSHPRIGTVLQSMMRRTLADIAERELPANHKYPTLEMRICDVCTRVDEAIAIAAIFQAVCYKCWKLRTSNMTFRVYPSSLIDENKWRAVRYGLDGNLIDFGKQRELPARDLVAEMIEWFIGDVIDELGSRAEVEYAYQIMRDGTSAHRQLAVFEQTGDLKAVVDQLIRETEEGVL